MRIGIRISVSTRLTSQPRRIDHQPAVGQCGYTQVEMRVHVASRPLRTFAVAPLHCSAALHLCAHALNEHRAPSHGMETPPSPLPSSCDSKITGGLELEKQDRSLVPSSDLIRFSALSPGAPPNPFSPDALGGSRLRGSSLESLDPRQPARPANPAQSCQFCLPSSLFSDLPMVCCAEAGVLPRSSFDVQSRLYRMVCTVRFTGVWILVMVYSTCIEDEELSIIARPVPLLVSTPTEERAVENRLTGKASPSRLEHSAPMPSRLRGGGAGIWAWAGDGNGDGAGAGAGAGGCFQGRSKARHDTSEAGLESSESKTRRLDNITSGNLHQIQARCVFRPPSVARCPAMQRGQSLFMLGQVASGRVLTTRAFAESRGLPALMSLPSELHRVCPCLSTSPPPLHWCFSPVSAIVSHLVISSALPTAW